MKIMIVTPYFYPKIGGLENYALQAAQGLKAQGHEVFVVTTNHIARVRTEETVQGLRVFRLPIRLKISNTPINFSWYWQLRAIIKQEKPDVINAHSPVPFIADMAFAARGRTPFVLTYHAGSLKKGGVLIDAVLGLYEKTFLKHMFMSSTEVISVYPAFIQRLIGKKRHLHSVPPGVDISVFMPSTTTAHAAATVLFVGRIERSSNWKGITVLMRAVQLASKTRTNIRLQLVGTGDALDDYRKLAARLGIEQRVVFSDALRGQKLVSAYQQASMVVLPSTTDAESFGMVLIEAMACGTPVIGSNIGGIPNVITDRQTGLLAKPGDAVDLSDKIIELLSDEALRISLTASGLASVTQNYTLEQNVQKTNSVLQTAVEPHIVHVSGHYPPFLGGLEQVVESLAEYQLQRGSVVRVITSNQGMQAKHTDRVAVKRLASLEVAHTPIMPSLFFELLKIKKRDIVHVHVAQAGVPEMVWLASKLRGFRYVAHVHLDVPPSGPAGVLLKFYKPFILKSVLRSARAVVVFTDEQVRDITQKYGLNPSRVRVIANGADESFFTDQPRTLSDIPTLLFVGRLSFQKNISQLLQALDGISDKVRTKLVGDGDLTGDLQRLATELHLQHVSFEGRAGGKKLLNYYATNDIFVLPSIREGMPLVLLEAMAMGMPIIATNVSGNKDLVQDGKNGILVPLHDAAALQRAIIRLIHNPKLYQKLSYGAVQASSNYTWPHIVEAFDDLYKEVIKS